MSGWIWMNDVEGPALADPIKPVCPDDNRESAKALIEKHREKIDKVKEELKDEPLYEPDTKHDDLWILRFVLSHKSKTKPAVKAAKHTLEFRQKWKLDEKDIRAFHPHKVKEGNVYEYWQKRLNGDGIVMLHPDKQRGVLMFIKFGHMNPDAVNVVSQEAWDESFIYSSEFAHQWLDYTTRTTGLFTRSIRILDMRGVSLKHFSRKNTQRDAKIMDQMEDCYPQLLESLFVCYAPSFMHLIWSIARKLMPKRVTEKVDVIEPHQNEKERQRILHHISMENLHQDFGGTNTTPVVEMS